MRFFKQIFKVFLEKFRNASLPKDYLLDQKKLEERAMNGDISAQFLVGYAMTEGRFGFQINLEAGKAWLNLAGKQLLEPPGYCATAHFYMRFKLYKKALLYLANAEESSYIPAQFLWAVTTYHKCLLKEHQNETGDHNVRREIIKKIKYCSKQGFVPAITFLGERYLDSWGVKLDARKGLHLLLKAASKGDCPAKMLLARLYENGVQGIIPMNMHEARKWYDSAATQGLWEATEALKKQTLGQVIAWPLEDVEKMIRIFIRRGNKEYNKHQWKLVKQSENVFIVEENGKVPVFTLTGIEKDQNVTIKFNQETPLSKRAAMFTLLICASPVIIDSSSLENMKILLEEVAELNKILNFEKKIKVQFSERTLEEFKDKEDQLRAYPLVKQAIHHQMHTC